MKINKNRWIYESLTAIILCFLNGIVFAETRIAILEFELKDLTMIPRTPAEITRTLSIKPLLEAELKKLGYVIIDIAPKYQKFANSGVGYLFDHHDVAANLGKQFDADYIFVGRLHKPSFLFAYLMGHLIRVRDAKLIGNYVSEAKGPSRNITIKAVESLAVKIDQALDHRYSRPLSSKQR